MAAAVLEFQAAITRILTFQAVTIRKYLQATARGQFHATAATVFPGHSSTLAPENGSITVIPDSSTNTVVPCRKQSQFNAPLATILTFQGGTAT